MKYTKCRLKYVMNLSNNFKGLRQSDSFQKVRAYVTFTWYDMYMTFTMKMEIVKPTKLDGENLKPRSNLVQK